MAGVNSPYRYQYEHVNASQTGQVLGGTGAIGDYLHRLVVTVATAATGNVILLDGTDSHTIVPASTGSGVNVFSIEINARSALGAWSITTGAGVEVYAVGIFSA